MPITEDKLKPCVCEEGLLRGITVSQAESMCLCGSCRDGFCSKYKECHGVSAKKENVVLSWYTGKVRLNWKWHPFDVLAYSRDQAIKLLRDAVGYHIRIGSSDCKLEFRRYLTAEETATKGCRIRVN